MAVRRITCSPRAATAAPRVDRLATPCCGHSGPMLRDSRPGAWTVGSLSLGGSRDDSTGGPARGARARSGAGGAEPARRPGREPGDHALTVAVQRVVIEEADGLHERVADRRSHEAEPAASQVGAERARHGGLGGHRAHRAPPALLRPPRDEAPQVLGERAVLGLHGQERPRVPDGGLDLPAVAHDALVREEPANVPGAEAGDAPGVEARERAPVALALPQDGRPRQPGLGALEEQELEEPPVVAYGHAPLTIVILDVERVARPVAAATRERSR